MTDKTENVPENPPAFPAFIPGSLAEHPGMSLRDWFAGQALAGWCMNNATSLLPEEYAAEAYACADAMLAAREQSQ